MKYISNPSNMQLHHTIVTLGKFDGCHIGHQLLFNTAVGLKEAGDQVVIFTFSVPPAAVLNENDKDRLLSIQTHEERMLQEYPEGIDCVVEFPFNDETRRMSPESFVKDILVERLGVKAVVAGDDFRFGKDRAGDIYTLKELGLQYGFQVVPVEKVKCHLTGIEEEQEVSSTLIKEEIRKGHMENVNILLGRPFSMSGVVMQGKRLGRTIGFPTINFHVPEDKILPPNGVYVTRTCVQGRIYDSITNVGTRPTFDDGTFRTVETNIFDFQDDVYGQTLRVDFYSYLRPERKFSSAEELMKEIESNIRTVRNYFSESGKQML